MAGGHDPVHEQASSIIQATGTCGGGFPLLHEPLVLRCRQGEWVAVELFNDLPAGLEVEPLAPGGALGRSLEEGLQPGITPRGSTQFRCARLRWQQCGPQP